jgi:acetyl esterase
VPLDPVSQQVNDLVVNARAGSTERTVDSMRAGYEQLFSHLEAPETTCAVAPIDVGGLPSLLLTPPDANDGLLVWFHGGGFVLGAPELTVAELDLLCTQARCRAVSVGYRRTPESPLPGPQRDAIAATEWCLAHAGSLGVDPRRVAVGGDSAGGNLSAVVAQRVGGLLAQVLVYPGTDMRRDDVDDFPHPEGYVLDVDTMSWFSSLAGSDIDVADPLVSPELASQEVLASVPPALFITAEHDPLRDQGHRYAQALREAGVHVEAAHFEEQMHLFWSMPTLVNDARVAISLAASFLSTRFASV